jgi:hypothetical protein
MRGLARFMPIIVGCLALGCSTMRPSNHAYKGITDPQRNAVLRTFPTASSTLVAGRLAEVMTADPILENVELAPEASREFRNFTKADRQALGIGLLPPTNDVNYTIRAKCKDGGPVAALIRLKGEAGCEVSVVYGFGGDTDLGRDLLDKVELALASPGKEPPQGTPVRPNVDRGGASTADRVGMDAQR